MPRIPDALEAEFTRYVRAPARVRAALSGLGPASLNRRPPGSDWSIRDIVIHLCDAELVRATRFMAIVASDEPPIPAYDEELYKRRLQYLWRDPELALTLFQHTRFAMAEMLQQCSAEHWERTGIHSEEGPISLAELLRRGADHGDEHLQQIVEFREAVGEPVPDYALPL
ncbi:MAG: DinB family protein [Dehalococcoidia bacterium]|nr:DinB family protein [Dehalococcoidia bacterium]